MTGATPAMIGRAMRVDPADLPARYSVTTETGLPAAVYLDDSSVVVKRRLSGLPLTLSVPIGAYEGVAVRIGVNEAGDLTASVELRHRDPGLTLPLAVTRDMEQAAEDWKAWSEALALPMLLIEADRVVPVPVLPPISLDNPAPRRRRGPIARRPRFLVRRQPGRPGPYPVFATWREIIAPE